MRNTQIEQFLIENYSSKGSYYCSNALNLKRRTVCTYASRLKLKLNNKTKLESTQIGLITRTRRKRNFKVNPEQFFKIQTPEVAYILGLLWADGNLYKDMISIECKEDDLKTLKWIFDKTGLWKEYHRNREGRQPLMALKTNNKPLRKFLEENDYKSKTNTSADKILSKIPDHLKHYWFRGLFDGDGCFYIGKNNRGCQISISSSFEQDWKYIEDFLKTSNIFYNLSRRIFNKIKNYRGSEITIRRIKDINLFCSIIYKNYNLDNIGLKRKYDKYISFLNYKNLN